MTRLTLSALAGLTLVFAAAPLLAQGPAVIQTGNPIFGGNCPPPAIVFPDCPTPTNPGAMPANPNPNLGGGTADGTGTGTGAGTGTDMAALPERGGGGGIGSSAEFTPPMFGDLLGVSGKKIIVLPAGVTHGPNGQPAKIVSGNKAIIVAPLPGRSFFNITENESPRPTDRVYLDYDYFNNVAQNLHIPGVNGDLNRETVGFEKTFLNGDASFGMRLPFLQLTGSSDIQDSQAGDLSLIFKYAFLNNRETGNLLSGGMVLTVPTGPGLELEGESTIHSTVFQPFVGWIYHLNRDLFLQGFSAVAVPTDERDVTLMFNSIAVGYNLYHTDEPDAILRGIVPVTELHVNTPLNHRNQDDNGIFFPDEVDWTAGVYFEFRRATFGMAVGTPFTGPKLYDIEATASLTFHF